MRGPNYILHTGQPKAKPSVDIHSTLELAHLSVLKSHTQTMTCLDVFHTHLY